MKIFSFSGSSGSGKTTVIKNLISVLSSKYRIMYIKDMPHGNISLDTEGKDTWIMENAGAAITYGLAPEKTYMMSEGHTDLEDIISSRSSIDMVFIEGFRFNNYGTKFLVLGNEEYLKSKPDYVIRANNNTYMGKCFKYPDDINLLLNLITAN
ncbi:MAG: molybdopterin-guanine dinucleotide biosynthesis protein B [Ferroplasma sp.]